MPLNLEDLTPVSSIITYDEIIIEVLSFVTSIIDTYNSVIKNCEYFHPTWATVGAINIIGREQMLDFIRQLNSNNMSNTFIKTVNIYTQIYNIRQKQEYYRQRKLVYCCDYNQMIEDLKNKLPV